MFATHHRTVTSCWLRIVRGLLVALALLSGVPGLVPLALAEEPSVRDQREPDVRVRLFINKIIVHDDNDWGKGDISIRTRIHTGSPACGPGSCDKLLVESTLPEFEATDGQVVQLDRMIPAFGDSVFGGNAGPELGFPVRFDQGYNVSITGNEIDTVDDDYMGNLNIPVLNASGQVRFGVFTERSIGLCNGKDRDNPCESHLTGDFSVEYEFRPMALPDLRPVDIKVTNVAGTTNKQVCTAVQNAGVADAGPVQITILMDGTALPDGRFTGAAVRSGQAGELCAQMALPITGPHQLTALVDEPRAIPEYSETNNQYVESVVIARTEDSQPTPTATPSPAPATDDADLTVSAIRVNGKTPDGSSDCKDGKSSISAVIKNTGARDADDFVVRLVVDGDQTDALERSVSGLKDGQEREVRFGDVRLKKGDHQLAVTVDVKSAVTEANEGNNMLDVTASCSDGR